MYEETKQGLDEARAQAEKARTTIRETNRSALRNYLRAAFTFQRAGLEALDALQKGAEELTFSMLDRAEEAQEHYSSEAATRLRESAERLREARERIQARIREERGDIGEGNEMAESRLRESAEIGLKVVKVLESRIENMLAELVDMGRRELNEIEQRVDALVRRLDEELEEEIHPIANYDEKNVEEIRAALAGLDEMQLRTVRAYEVAHKNRVTVLRAIDERLAEQDEIDVRVNGSKSVVERVAETVSQVTNPIPNYDELNVQEVEAALRTLNAAELGALRAYEMAHKERVTVLRAIDERLGELGQTEDLS